MVKALMLAVLLLEEGIMATASITVAFTFTNGVEFAIDQK